MHKLEKIDQIDIALMEARRFIQRAIAWKRRIKSDEFALISGSKEGGAAKRASLDLSRALAEIRRSSL